MMMRLFLVLSLLLVFAMPHEADAEVIEYHINKPIGFGIKPDVPYQVIFPLPLKSVEKHKDSTISVRSPNDLKDTLVFEGNAPGSKENYFLTDIHGNRYHLTLQVLRDAKTDEVVVIHNAAAEAAKSIKAVDKTPLTDLLKAMASDQRLKGYALEKKEKPERIYLRDGLAVYVHRVYHSPFWTGYVCTVENTNPYPVSWDVRQFNYPGLVAIGAKRDLLYQKPSTASELISKKYKTRMEFVVDTTTNPNDLGPLK